MGLGSHASSMNSRKPKPPAVVRALGSIIFTLIVWVWMLTRPAGAFHDQGGMAITFIYFPATFGVWLYCCLTSVLFLVRRTKGGTEAEGAQGPAVGWRTLGLIVLGLLLSVGTLAIA